MRGYEPVAIASLLVELKTLNIQSNQRYAEAYVYMRMQKGFGPLRIQAELQQRGVAAEIIQRVLDPADTCWVEQLQKVRQKKFGTPLPRDFKIQARQMRFLQTRGFSSEQINRALKNTAPLS